MEIENYFVIEEKPKALNASEAYKFSRAALLLKNVFNSARQTGSQKYKIYGI